METFELPMGIYLVGIIAIAWSSAMLYRTRKVFFAVLLAICLIAVLGGYSIECGLFTAEEAGGVIVFGGIGLFFVLVVLVQVMLNKQESDKNAITGGRVEQLDSAGEQQ